MHLVKPLGLLSLLDEESSLTQGNDDTCVIKFNKQYGNDGTRQQHKDFLQSKTSAAIFSIIHYAGIVQYSGKDIVNTNRDSLAQDDVMCFQKRY